MAKNPDSLTSRPEGEHTEQTSDEFDANEFGRFTLRPSFFRWAIMTPLPKESEDDLWRDSSPPPESAVATPPSEPPKTTTKRLRAGSARKKPLGPLTLFALFGVSVGLVLGLGWSSNREQNKKDSVQVISQEPHAMPRQSTKPPVDRLPPTPFASQSKVQPPVPSPTSHPASTNRSTRTISKVGSQRATETPSLDSPPKNNATTSVESTTSDVGATAASPPQKVPSRFGLK